MKAIFPLGITLFFFYHFTCAQAVGERPANAKVNASSFEGHWRGEEKCQNIGAPVSQILITVQGDEEVTISGLYSTVGPVLGKVKGNVISVPKQVVPDPIFKNLKIQGNLTLSHNRQSLQAVFMIFNNDARDDCSTNYHRD
jgi:hypothetical protein